MSDTSEVLAGLVGDEWHEVKRKTPTIDEGYPNYLCTCGHQLGGRRAKESFEIHCALSNPTYTIETIKQAIQSVHCGYCNGHGRLPITPSGCLPHDNDRDCPYCTNGKRDEWDGFVRHVRKTLWDLADRYNGGNTYQGMRTIINDDDVALMLVDIITTPKPAKQAYITYRNSVPKA